MYEHYASFVVDGGQPAKDFRDVAQLPLAQPATGAGLVLQLGFVTAEVAIRPARLADEPAIRACVEAAYAIYRPRMSATPAPVLADYRALIAREVVDVAVLGAETRDTTNDTTHGTTNDEIVGVIVMWPSVDHLFIENIAVRPDAQGNGVGSQLLDHAERLALQLGLYEIRLYTNEAMTENVEFYQRHGFVEAHRQTDGEYRRVYFVRTLR